MLKKKKKNNFKLGDKWQDAVVKGVVSPALTPQVVVDKHAPG